MKRVVVLGGGVAGMSAAHELAERGFAVSVYERRGALGGKARSVPVPRTAVGPRPPLPGEHGFRFFPGFYRHVTDTMKRIPYGGNTRGVYDNLVDSTRVEILVAGRPAFIGLARFPASPEDVAVLLRGVGPGLGVLGVSDADVEFFATRLWRIITSCKDRRMDEYEKIGWWDFVEAARCDLPYQQLLGGGLSRTLVAAQPKLASARTGGDILLQLLFNMFSPGVSADRVLNGPTNDVWIDPWRRHLTGLNVDFQPNTTVTGIRCAHGRIAGVTVQRERAPEHEVTGDYYIAALPVEAMAALLYTTSRDLLDADASLAGIIELSTDTAWMNGIQFYLKEDAPLVHGHQIYADSAWALTSLSQQQFWPDFKLSEYGDGTVRGILSVDISDWQAPGVVHHKPAIECSPPEIKDDVWEQLKQSLNARGARVLTDENLRGWFLDPDILAKHYLPRLPVRPENADPTNVNLEPLLVNKKNTWHLRPDAYTRIPNLFLAADYVRTNTDLATMEGANEAARRAVNSVIDASASPAPYCEIWDLHEPWVFEPWRAYDQSRYDNGLPWGDAVPWTTALLQAFRVWRANVGGTAPKVKTATPRRPRTLAGRHANGSPTRAARDGAGLPSGS